MAESLTITVTPKMLGDEWALVYEWSLADQTLLTVSPMLMTDAEQLPAATDTSEYVIKLLGNVVAREAGGCFAPNKTRAILTFDAQRGKVKRIA